jgi:hypothetical protein
VFEELVELAPEAMDVVGDRHGCESVGMCRALKVLCVATNEESLASLRAASVSAEWELVPGVVTEAEAFDVIDVERPQVLVAFGPYERLVSLVRERFPGMRIVADRDAPGADAVVDSLEQVRGSVKGGPRPTGPVVPPAAPPAKMDV